MSVREQKTPAEEASALDEGMRELAVIDLRTRLATAEAALTRLYAGIEVLIADCALMSAPSWHTVGLRLRELRGENAEGRDVLAALDAAEAARRAADEKVQQARAALDFWVHATTSQKTEAEARLTRTWALLEPFADFTLTPEQRAALAADAGRVGEVERLAGAISEAIPLIIGPYTQQAVRILQAALAATPSPAVGAREGEDG